MVGEGHQFCCRSEQRFVGVSSLRGYQTEIGFRLTDLVAAVLRAPAGERCAVEVVDGLCG